MSFLLGLLLGLLFGAALGVGACLLYVRRIRAGRVLRRERRATLVRIARQGGADAALDFAREQGWPVETESADGTIRIRLRS